MKQQLSKQGILALANNPRLQMMMATLQTPPEVILDSGLKDILMIFEDEAQATRTRSPVV